jgi:hypothetical protein
VREEGRYLGWGERLDELEVLDVWRDVCAGKVKVLRLCRAWW